METLDSRFNSLKSELFDLEEPSERLEFFIERAQAEPPLDSEYRIESFKVAGCISQLWIVPSLDEGRCGFLCDGDAVIPKGIALIVLDLFQGLTPEDILQFDSTKLKQLGISELLTPNRRNALSSVFAAIHSFAVSAAVAENVLPEFSEKAVVGLANA